MSPVSAQSHLTKNLGVSDRAIRFLASFHGARYGGFDVVHGFLSAALPALSGGCGVVYTFFHGAGDIVACFLSGGWREKQGKNCAYADPNSKCCVFVRPIHVAHLVRPLWDLFNRSSWIPR